MNFQNVPFNIMPNIIKQNKTKEFSHDLCLIESGNTVHQCTSHTNKKNNTWQMLRTSISIYTFNWFIRHINSLSCFTLFFFLLFKMSDTIVFLNHFIDYITFIWACDNHLGFVVELAIKLIIWFAIITWFIANYILS
jgi:hypothetical protein